MIGLRSALAVAVLLVLTAVPSPVRPTSGMELEATTFALDTSTASPSLALLRDDRPVAELWLAPEPGSGRRV